MNKGALALLLLFAFPACAAGPVNINTADQATLETLTGIGPTKAKAIIEYRVAHGPFVRIEDIEEVKGIGPATFSAIKNSITIETLQQPEAAEARTVSSVSAVSSSPPQAVAVKTVRKNTPAPAPEDIPSIQKRSATQVGEVKGVSAEQAPSSNARFWFSLGALAVLVGGGAMGVRYLQRPAMARVPLTAEDFDIE